MSNKEETIIRATVTEALPNTLFRLDIDGKETLAYLSGKMRMHRIKVLVGDTVEVVLDPYGGKGRIVKRVWIPLEISEIQYYHSQVNFNH